MKKGIILLLSILVFAGCSGQKKATDSTIKVEYKAYSRGFYQVVTIENQMVFITKTRDEKPVAFKIPIADWKSLNMAIQELDLELLSQLKAPTEKRLYDGAFVAHLKIFYKDKIFETQAFDHGFPPKEIKKLVDKINILAKTE
jgi:PBP1b-binding outer membrane lipoprotein LpoB